MLKTTKFLSAFFAFIILFSMGSCSDNSNVGGPNDISNSIPSNATGVFLMNTKQLMEKADYESLKQTSFFKDWIAAVKKESPEMVPFLNDPAAAGINMESNIGFYFSIPKDFLKNNRPETGFIMPIADKAKADEAVKVALKEHKGTAPQVKDGYTITALSNNLNLIQSDKLLAFVSFDDEEKIQNLLHPSEDNIHANPSFVKRHKESKDVMFWMAADAIVEAALNNPFTAMQIQGGLAIGQIPEEALTGNYMSFFYDFKQGEMDAGMSFDFNDILKQELGDIFPNKLEVDYSNYIPSDNLAAAATLGVNSSGVLNFLTKRGLDRYANNYLSMTGLDLGQIRDGITGDLAFGIYAPAPQANDPGIVLALGIKDKAFIENLFAKAGPVLKRDGEKYIFTGGGNMMDPSAPPLQFFALIQKDVLLVTNANDLLDKAAAGNGNKIVTQIQDGWMGMFLDYNLINENYDIIANYLPVDPESLAFSKMMSEYQNISTATVLAKGNAINGTTVLKASDVNSLKSLLQSIDKMYQDRAKIQEEMEKQMEDEFDSFDEEFGALEEQNT